MPNKSKIETALSASLRPVILESRSKLLHAAEEWTDSSVLGIDTEFIRERTYRADLGLVQISNGLTAWLVDPIALDSLEPLEELMRETSVTKILHSGSEVLEILQNELGTLPNPLVDTQIACAMLGQPLQMGYHHAVKWLFEIEVDKDQTRSKWLRRPLSSDQIRYAAVDVVLLPMMLEILQRRLEDMGRWSWLQEDVARMQRNSLTGVEPGTSYLRLLRNGRLDDPSLKVLQALAAWREITAKSKNLARGFVITDAGLMQMARLKPGNASELRTIDEVHPNVLSRYQEILLNLIEEAQQSHAAIVKIEDLNNEQKRKLAAMRQLITTRSKQLDVDPALLGSRRELEKLIRATADDEAIPERFLGWRKSVITDDLLEILN